MPNFLRCTQVRKSIEYSAPSGQDQIPPEPMVQVQCSYQNIPGQYLLNLDQVVAFQRDFNQQSQNYENDIIQVSVGATTVLVRLTRSAFISKLQQLPNFNEIT